MPLKVMSAVMEPFGQDCYVSRQQRTDGDVNVVLMVLDILNTTARNHSTPMAFPLPSTMRPRLCRNKLAGNIDGKLERKKAMTLPLTLPWMGLIAKLNCVDEWCRHRTTRGRHTRHALSNNSYPTRTRVRP